MSQPYEISGLLLKTGLNHLLHALVDAVVQFGPFAVQSDLNYAEIPFFPGFRTLCGEFFAGCIKNFQGMDDTHRILEIRFMVIFGIYDSQFCPQALDALFLHSGVQRCPQLRVYIRQIVNPVAYSIDVQHGAARHHYHIVRGKQTLQERQDFRLKPGGMVSVKYRMGLDEMMGYLTEDFFSGDGRPDGHFPENLSRIAGDDFGLQVPGNENAKSSFPDPGRAKEN